MFDKVLIANRGAIACRIQRTLRRLGVASVAVYSEADRSSAARARCRPGDLPSAARPPPIATSAPIASSQAAIATGAQAIHPGYGFLSENAQFARSLRARRARLRRADAGSRCATSG